MIAIIGPTGSGKTDLAVQISAKLSINVVNADSRQIYKLMDIGTAKPTSTERKKLKDGGVTGDTLVEGYGDLIDAWVRKIDLADPDESLTEYINRVRKSEAKSNE